ncbi:MAG: aldose 1-epimerase [Collimonas sp.]|uniref:aldose 1-epimerase n=1 Tax=Collimonas sp. TaxID=1963772 RepID=UPI00326706B7
MTTLLLSPECSLRNGEWQLTLSPSAGGRITSLSSTREQQTTDWIVPMPEQCRQYGFPASAWPKAGIYPLLPFSNRIRNGKFSWENLVLSLPLHPGEPHAMHGFGHTVEWQLLACDSNSAEMLYSHNSGDNGWPWAFLAKQTIVLEAGALAMKMEIVNISSDALPPMPLGAGFHPYFPRRFAHHVGFDAHQLWQADAEHVAIGVGDVPVQYDYRDARPIARDEEMTLYYGGWKRQAGITDQQGNRIAMSASPLLAHLVLHAPAALDYFCIEPVTHVADAFNLAQAGFANTGLQRLPSGQTFSCDIRLDFFDAITVAESP